MSKGTALNVGIVLANNFTLSAFSLFVDTLRLAADEADLSRPIGCQWQVMHHRQEPVRSSCGVLISPTSGLLNPRGLDYVVVVGGILHAGPQADPATVEYLRAAARAGTRLVGICTGSFILARAGLMAGRQVCVNWMHHQDFTEEFPDLDPVADRLFLVDGDRITCAGGAGSAHLAAHLVRQHLGRAAAQKSHQVLLFGQAFEGAEAQPHPPIGPAVADLRVRRALLLMEQNLSTPLSMETIATRLQMSARQLERLFQAKTGQSPASLYRELRLRYASWLLDTTDRSVTEIALEAGFADCAHFSRQFKAMRGFPPSARRGQAQPEAPFSGQRSFA